MKTFKDVERASALAGLKVFTWSPGDGVTRYRFFKAEGCAPSQSYFGPANGQHTALGAKAAYEYATSCENGIEMNVKYKIVRFYKNRIRNRHTLHSGVSLQVAQLHCNDPRTSKPGYWFDGYERM